LEEVKAQGASLFNVKDWAGAQVRLVCLYVLACVCTNVCVCAFECALMCMRACIECLYVTYMHVCTSVHAHVYVCISVHAHVYVCTCAMLTC